jgi:hypothetical protein
MKPTDSGSYVYLTQDGVTHIRWFRTAAEAQLYWTQLHEAGMDATIVGTVNFQPEAIK